MARTSEVSIRSSARKRLVSTGVRGKARARVGTPSAHAPRKVLVTVHGAGSFPDDYYKPLVAAIEQRLGGPFNYIPVYYADVTNPPTTGIAPMVAAPESPAAAKFKQDLLAEMQRSYDALPPTRRGVGIASAFGTGNVDGISLIEIIVKEVGQYLFTPNVASEIQQRLVAGLDQAAQTYDEIVLASLSLGTVVSFDVLKQCTDRYKISSWFTTGCPLGKLRRVGVRPPDLGAIQPANVARWLNLYDTTDIVGDAIGPQFPGYRLYDIFVEVGSDPISAHDYFNNPATLDLIADAMR